MKLKYFMRGIGVGVIFGALIMLAAYMTSGSYKMNDEDVIKRAGELGMVMENGVLASNTDVDKKEPATEASTKEATTTEAPVTTEAVTTEAVTTEAATTEATTSEKVTATIEVTAGMSSTAVARLLEEAGIIDDYQDFDLYLNQNGYSTQIRINTYHFEKGMSYKEIAEELIKEDNL